jgi:xanthine/CO dehydrogenase XdhC/CoxF family maturation factor
MRIARSSSTVVPVSAPAPVFASVPAAGFSSSTAPRLESPVGTEAIGAASGVPPEIIVAQIQQLTQLLQQQQQQQQQRASKAEVDKAKKECSVSLGHSY